MTTAPERLVQAVKDIAPAFSRHGVQPAVTGGMSDAALGSSRATKEARILIDSRGSALAVSALRELELAGLAGQSGSGFVRFVGNPPPDLSELTDWVDLLWTSQATGETLLHQAMVHPIRWRGTPAASSLLDEHAARDRSALGLG